MGCNGYGCHGCFICKPTEYTERFSVGQVWVSTTNIRHKILCFDGTDIITKIVDGSKSLNVWDSDGRLISSPIIKLVKEYKEPRSKTVELFLYESSSGDGSCLWYSCRLGPSSKLLAQKTVTITEGEGM